MLTPEQTERLFELIAAALARPAAERAALLSAFCGDDTPLRTEAESLLRYEEDSRDFIEAPAIHVHAQSFLADDAGPSSALRAGETLAHYRVVSLLGDGGMGEVYLAHDLALGREVAIKVVKRGMASPALLRHFQQEKLILAALTHSHIASLYEGGLTPDGLPYLVMEYVRGESLDEYCDRQRLTVPGRLALFRKVCAAVAYAHQHLVIHRDLKPGNIRVTPEGEPKLLDFGIAKLLDPATTPGAEQTVTLLALMTPGYASPEQLRSEPMTTASDIYSLGIVLYENLCGVRPFAATRTSREQARAVSGEQTAERLSRVARRPGPESEARAAARGVSPVRLARELAGDLDNIVFKAMRQEPARRYPSVGEIASDLQRYLEGQPVTARQETWRYVGAKFLRRHRALAAAAALLLFSLIGGVIATTWQMRRADTERSRAERRLEDVRHLADSLIFEIHDSVQNLQGSLPTRQLIISRGLQYLDSLAREGTDNPALHADLANAYEKIGDIQGNPYFANLGDEKGARTSYGKAEAIRQILLAAIPSTETSIGLGRVERDLGDLEMAGGNTPAMLQRYRQSLALFESLARAHPADATVLKETSSAYEALADGLDRQGHAAAEVLHNYTLALGLARQLSLQEPNNLNYRRGWGVTYLKVGSASMPNAAAAVENTNRGIAILEELAHAHPDDARARRDLGYAYNSLGSIQDEAGDYAGAVDSYRHQLAIREAIASHEAQNSQAQYDRGIAHSDLAQALIHARQAGDAVQEADTGVAILQPLAAADQTNAIFGRNLAIAYERVGEASQLMAGSAEWGESQRLPAWKKAKAGFENARQCYLELRGRGAMHPLDGEKPETLAAQIAECQRALGQVAR